MKEFDFDELDRAVSSALGSNGGNSGNAKSISAPTASSPAATRATQVIDEPVQEREAPDISVPEREAPVVVERSAVPQRPRSSGRFMDVVHPSTDMRQTTPLSEVKLASEVVIPEPTPEPVAPREEVFMDDIKAVPRSQVQLPPVPSVEVEEATDNWANPTDSPFLPDAKVEKRPLGQSEPTGIAAVPVDEIEDEPLPTFEELTMDDLSIAAEPESVATEVPVGEVTMPEEPAASVVAGESETYPEDEIESVPEFDLDAIESANVAPADALAPVEEPAYAGPVAITPQYTAKPSSAQESGEIFDTETYHQPFAAPIKKKGGPLKIILIILLILLLGAGVGAVGYLYILPML